MTMMTKDGVTWDIPSDQVDKHLHHGWEFVNGVKAGEDIIRLKPATVLTKSTVTDLEQATNVKEKGDE
jgi:hypothetical protein